MRCGSWSSGRSARSCDRGYVTAETAVVIPSLVLLVGMLLWGLGAVGAQTRCGDAARAGARAMARGEQPADAMSVARSAAPAGAEVRVEQEGELYRVSVVARTLGPGPLAVPVTAEAVAHAEPE